MLAQDSRAVQFRLAGFRSHVASIHVWDSDAEKCFVHPLPQVRSVVRREQHLRLQRRHRDMT